MFKINYSINGVKRWIAPDPVWWGKHGVTVLGGAAVLVLLLLLAACSSGTATVAPMAQSCEGLYTATVEMPDHATRIASRNISLVNAGYTVTGDDSIDNSRLGGGTPDGGIYLSGSVNWKTGPLVGTQCPVIGGMAEIFGYQFAVNGAMNDPSKNTEFGIGYEGGPIVGIFNGKAFTGKLIEGGNPYVHGVLTNGTFTPVVK